MSLILSAVLSRLSYLNKAALAASSSQSRFISLGTKLFNDNSSEVNEADNNAEDVGVEREKKNVREKSRFKQHSYETSIRYLASEAYKTTYGSDPVWKQYRRNHKGAIPPRKTRKSCIRSGIIFTGNPCPICRDEYLVLDHRNPKLLNQFISEHNGAVLSYSKTGVCRKKHEELLVAIARAKDYGTITFDVPFREYDYSEWYKKSETEEVKN